jgi:DNA topoisomerase-3
MGLIEGYDNMGFSMSKPNLRAELEADLKRICDGIKDPKVVLAEQLAKYKEVFQIALQQVKVVILRVMPPACSYCTS